MAAYVYALLPAGGVAEVITTHNPYADDCIVPVITKLSYIALK
jgi:hypothetical protein